MLSVVLCVLCVLCGERGLPEIETGGMQQAIALIEVNSIALGIQTLDAMVKVAPVQVLHAKAMCPGKYVIVVGGEVSSVESSRDAGLTVAGETLIDRLFLPRPDLQIFELMVGIDKTLPSNAIGVIETFTVASTIYAADAAAKATSVMLADLKLAVGIGGKSFVSMVGDVSDVEASVEAGVAAVQPPALLVRQVVIPNPHPDVVRCVLGRKDVPRESDRNGGVHAEVPGT